MPCHVWCRARIARGSLRFPSVTAWLCHRRTEHSARTVSVNTPRSQCFYVWIVTGMLRTKRTTAWPRSSIILYTLNGEPESEPEHLPEMVLHLPCGTYQLTPHTTTSAADAHHDADDEYTETEPLYKHRAQTTGTTTAATTAAHKKNPDRIVEETKEKSIIRRKWLIQELFLWASLSLRNFSYYFRGYFMIIIVFNNYAWVERRLGRVAAGRGGGEWKMPGGEFGCDGGWWGGGW